MGAGWKEVAESEEAPSGEAANGTLAEAEKKLQLAGDAKSAFQAACHEWSVHNYGGWDESYDEIEPEHYGVDPTRPAGAWDERYDLDEESDSDPPFDPAQFERPPDGESGWEDG